MYFCILWSLSYCYMTSVCSPSSTLAVILLGDPVSLRCMSLVCKSSEVKVSASWTNEMWGKAQNKPSGHIPGSSWSLGNWQHWSLTGHMIKVITYPAHVWRDTPACSGGWSRLKINTNLFWFFKKCLQPCLCTEAWNEQLLCRSWPCPLCWTWDSQSVQDRRWSTNCGEGDW